MAVGRVGLEDGLLQLEAIGSPVLAVRNWWSNQSFERSRFGVRRGTSGRIARHRLAQATGPAAPTGTAGLPVSESLGQAALFGAMSPE